ncbi:MAG: TRAP transporter permease [Peptococcaceae bacterium]|nr:TRAP transporter permease [Peptococcaceae bacterium]
MTGQENAALLSEKSRNKYYFRFVSIIAVAMSVFQLYTGFLGTLEAYYQRTIHLMFALILVFLIYGRKGQHKKEVHWLDLIYVALALVVFGYLYVNYTYLVTERMYYITPLTTSQYILGVCCLALVLEATRRTSGPQLPIVCLVFILYVFLGPWVPGIFHHPGFSLGLLLDIEYLTTAGLFGGTMAISSSYLFLFILLGSVLAKTGFGDFLRDFSLSIAGWARGGPAKVAILASGFFGMISGSAVANVATVGGFTLPMMEKVGYRKEFSAGALAAASAGGQIMPPVMGVQAFLMAQYTGIPYNTIIKWALLPGTLYFLSMLFMADVEAVRLGLRGMGKNELPSLKNALKKSYFALPMVILVGLLIMGYTPNYAACATLVASFAIGFLDRSRRMTLRDVWDALEDGAKGAIPVVCSCATAGIIVGIVSVTGIGARFSAAVVSWSHGNVVLALLLTMVAGIILGMGLPTSAVYIIQVALIVPALIELGIPLYIAHMFVVYFAAISMITPPVCLASYTAANIAKANPMKTGWTGMRLGAVAYIVPFMFVFNPALLLEGRLSQVIPAVIMSLIGVYFLAVALGGVGRTLLNWPLRILYFIAALLTIWPGWLSDTAGIGLAGLLYLYQKRKIAAGKWEDLIAKLNNPIAVVKDQ